jgi:polar amino acid transport system substrate-binding protein
MGVLLEYDLSKELFSKPVEKNGERTGLKTDAVSFIGAGSFAGNFLLPNLKDEIRFSAVATKRPHSAENAKRKFGFEKAYADADELIAKDEAGAVVIATRHDSHAPLALAALKTGKRIFTEKPLCLTMEEWRDLIELSSEGDIMVGFNRRFSPAVVELKKKLSLDLPKVILYRVNAGHQPADHWVHDPEVGGGRILGEACHFVDLCTHIADSQVTSVSAVAMETQPQNRDSFTANFSFADGSVASLVYLSNGNKGMPKEMIEVSSGGFSAVIDDFKKLITYGSKPGKTKFTGQDKGHAAEMRAVARALKNGEPFPISKKEVFHSTLATFALLESVKSGGKKIEIEEFERQWTSPKVN